MCTDHLVLKKESNSKQPPALAGGGCPRPLPPLAGAVPVNGDGGDGGDGGADR
jgi:hypothetical protein